VKKLLPILKNKFLITFIVFSGYLIFLDDNDIFYILKQKETLNQLKEQNKIMKGKLETTRSELIKIEDLDYLEAYARQEKFFKRKDEDIFVITND
jgi:cell division protein FtsB